MLNRKLLRKAVTALILAGLSFYKNIIGESGMDDFEIVYYKYRNLMMYEAMRILNRTEEAEECVSEAFLKIAINSDKIYMKPCPKTANLFVIIVRNIAIDKYRKNKDELKLLKRLRRSDDTFFETEGENRIVSAIKELKPEYRDVLYLRFIYGYSVDEISAVTGINSDAVYKRIQRAKAKLEKILKEEHIL